MKSKNKQVKKALRNILVFTLIFSWIFSGWPNIWQNPLFPPKVQEVYAATDTYYGTYDSANSDMTNSSYAETDNTQYAAGDKANEKVVIQSWSGTAGSGVISGVRIYCQHYAASPDGNDFTLVEYSLDNWVSTGTTTGQQVMPGSESSFSVDIYADRAWNWTDIGNLEVRATAKADGKSNFGTDYIDVLYIQVDYTITTTLADGTDPGPSTVAPGSADNYLDQFSFVASSGTDTVTALTVTTANTTAVASVEIWNDAMSTQYYSTDSAPNGDAWEFSSGTEIPVTDSVVNFRVVFDAKDHATLSAGTYGVTGTVTSYTCTNSQAGSDTDSATITVDNSPPSDATWGTIIPGNVQIELNWTNPGADFYRVLILRNTSAVTDTPTEGTEYTAGQTIGSSAVRYANNAETFTDDSGLVNDTDYYYKIFAYDNYINYASGTGTGPHTPADAAATLTFSLETNSLPLGTLSPTAATTGSHTINVSTNAANGMNVTVTGTTLTSSAAGNPTITACSTGCTSTTNSEQFGINLKDNATPDVGAEATGTAPIGVAATGYATADTFRFVSGEIIASSAGAINDTTFTISYMVNISAATEAGSYTTNLTYVASGAF